jgi:tRNA(Ile)-lysidine synthase
MFIERSFVESGHDMKFAETENDLPSKIRRTIEQYRMIDSGMRVVVGVSGGPDSTALLHILNILKDELDFRISVAHLDHGLRPESRIDADFVAETAKRLQSEFRIKKMNIFDLAEKLNVSVEEAGRRARYQFLEETRISCQADVIATGHHRDDEVETFFLRIFRGSSIKGLCGIPPVRGRIIRPLINSDRSEILDFLKQHEISYRIDKTNLEADTDRNFIRNRIAPVIEGRFPHFRAPLKRTMDLIKYEDNFLEREVTKIYADSVTHDAASLTVNMFRLRDLPEAIVARLLLRALHDSFGAEIRWRQSHLRSMSAVIRRDNPSATLHLPNGIELVREYDLIRISRNESKELPRSDFITVSGPGRVVAPRLGRTIKFSIFAKAENFHLNKSDRTNVYFDADALKFPLVVRTPKPGDRFRPWGTGGTRKLKKILIDLKIPLQQRKRIPLLVKDEEILCILGVRRGSVAPVGLGTRSILMVTLIDEPSQESI